MRIMFCLLRFPNMESLMSHVFCIYILLLKSLFLLYFFWGGGGQGFLPLFKTLLIFIGAYYDMIVTLLS